MNLAENVATMSRHVDRTERTIAFLILPDVHLLDLAGPVQVFYEAAQPGGIPFSPRFVAARPEIPSAQGLSVSRLEPPGEVRLTEMDFLIIPGIDFESFRNGHSAHALDEVAGWLKEQFEKKVQIATICTGALVPAELGLLKNRRCTTHWKCIPYMKERYPGVRVLGDHLFVRDGNVYSSAGMTSGIDMCIAIVEELCGPILASRVAREMVIYLRRDRKSTQESVYLDYQTHFNPAVHRVQNYIISHPEENPDLEELSAIANMSTRNLTRTFREVTGHTITEFKQEIKAGLARTLLNNPEYTLETVASKCGYRNVRQLQRIWRAKYGRSLSESRRKTSTDPPG